MDYNQPNYPYQPNTTNANQDQPPYMAYQQYPSPNQQHYSPSGQMPFPSTPPYPTMKPPVSSFSYEDATIEGLLKMNRGKVITIYMTFPSSKDFVDKIFKGVVESVGKDHVIVADPKSGKRFVLPYSTLDWIEFDDEIKYDFIR